MLACIACLYFSDDTRIQQYYLERRKKLKWSIFHVPSTYDAAPYRFTSPCTLFTRNFLNNCYFQHLRVAALKHYTTRLHFNTQRNYVMSRNSNSLEFTRKKKRWTLFFQNHYRSGTFSFFFRQDLSQSFTRLTAQRKLKQFCCCFKEHWQNSVWPKKRIDIMKIVLREKCPNKEFFLVHIFPYLDRIWKIQTKENSVFGHFSHSAV